MRPSPRSPASKRWSRGSAPVTRLGSEPPATERGPLEQRPAGGRGLEPCRTALCAVPRSESRCRPEKRRLVERGSAFRPRLVVPPATVPVRCTSSCGHGLAPAATASRAIGRPGGAPRPRMPAAPPDCGRRRSQTAVACVPWGTRPQQTSSGDRRRVSSGLSTTMNRDLAPLGRPRRPCRAPPLLESPASTPHFLEESAARFAGELGGVAPPNQPLTSNTNRVMAGLAAGAARGRFQRGGAARPWPGSAGLPSDRAQSARAQRRAPRSQPHEHRPGPGVVCHDRRPRTAAILRIGPLPCPRPAVCNR